MCNCEAMREALGPFEAFKEPLESLNAMPFSEAWKQTFHDLQREALHAVRQSLAIQERTALSFPQDKGGEGVHARLPSASTVDRPSATISEPWKLLETLLWDGYGAPDHMTYCEKTMGATHPCTCGADAARSALMAAQAVHDEQARDGVYRHGRHAWCQPGDQPHRAWILRFNDQDMREMVWTDEDAEAEARAAWNRYAPAWNCYLFCAAEQEPEQNDQARRPSIDFTELEKLILEEREAYRTLLDNKSSEPPAHTGVLTDGKAAIELYRLIRGDRK